MKDYKNVKVPKRYRSGTKRAAEKRVSARSEPKSRRSPVLGALVTVLTIIVALGSAYTAWVGYRWLSQSQTFMIAAVDIKGVKRLAERDFQAVAAPFTGQNIFRVDLEAAARRALANPWVQDIRIHRRLPNRLSMVVTEREPAALLEAGKQTYLIDREGVVIERVAAEANADRLPRVLVKNATAAPGEPVSGGAVPEALALLGELSTRGGWSLEEVLVKADGSESLAIVYAGHEFRIGDGRFGEKLRRLKEVLADAKLRGMNIVYVDLRPERQAAVMVKKDRGR